MNYKFTVFLILVTVISKSIGFVREILLLGKIGISSDLDTFLVLMAISTLVISIVGSSVMTSIAPIAKINSSPDQILDLLIEGLKVGLFLATITFVLNFSYVLTLEETTGHGASYIPLAALMSLFVIFGILAEYQVGIFISRGIQFPIISGNILLSVPPILAMLLFQIDILSFVFAFLLAYLLRASIWTYLIWRPPSSHHSIFNSIKKPTKLRTQLLSITAGGSAITATQFIFLGGLLVASQLGPGEASTLGYSLKIPLLVLSSLGFVMGVRFFSEIVSGHTTDYRGKLLGFSLVNIFTASTLAVVIIVIVNFRSSIESIQFLQVEAYWRIIEYSIYTIPIILFVPMIEMVQRSLVTNNLRVNVVPIALAILISGCLLFLAGLFIHNIVFVMISISISLSVGAIAAYYQLNRSIPAAISV